jgi:hypothetical protein
MAYTDNPQEDSTSDTGSTSESTTSQQAPIRVASDVEANAAEPETKISYRSLPNKSQLALLCIARMADPLAATSIQVCTSSSHQILN